MGDEFCQRPVSSRQAMNVVIIYLGLRKHINQPAADRAVGAASNQIVGVLRSHHLHRVYWMGMSSSRQWRLEDGEVLGTCVPEQDLSGVCTTEYQIGVEWRECHRQHV